MLDPRIESPVATIWEPSYGYRRGAYQEAAEFQASMIHTTGWGPVRRHREQGRAYSEPTPFDTALRMYRSGIVGRAGPHYLVGQQGQCAQMCPEGLAAWHVGKKRSGRYRWGFWQTRSLRWWGDRWEGMSSPRDLAGGMLWAGGSCNANTKGIEVVPPETGARDPWSDECWGTLVDLVLDLHKRNGKPPVRERVLTHSDAHPIARSAKGEPWDPSPTQWSWEAFADRAGLPLMCGGG